MASSMQGKDNRAFDVSDANRERSESGSGCGPFQEVGADTEYEAGRNLQQLKLQQEGNEYDDEDRRKAEQTGKLQPTGARHGQRARGLEKQLTLPTDIVKETGSENEYGGPKKAGVAKGLVDGEETPAEAATSDLEDADRMASQSFDNVGRVDN